MTDQPQGNPPDQPQSNPPAENAPKPEVGTDEKGKTSEPVAVETPPSKPVEEEPKPSPPVAETKVDEGEKSAEQKPSKPVEVEPKPSSLAAEAKAKIEEGEKAAEQKLQSNEQSETKAITGVQHLRRTLFQQSSASQSAKCTCGECEKVGCRCCRKAESGIGSVTEGASSVAKKIRKGLAVKLPATGGDTQEKTEQESQGSWTNDDKKKRHSLFNASNMVLLAFIAGAVISTIIAVKRMRLQ